jgi:hypothetical protein
VAKANQTAEVRAKAMAVGLLFGKVSSVASNTSLPNLIFRNTTAQSDQLWHASQQSTLTFLSK